MREFGMRGHGRGRDSFGGHPMVKPLAIGAVLFVVLGLLVMSLWNALLPALFGVSSIGFWQALGLLILCRILFGGLGMRPGMFGMARERRRMHARWMNMTPEEREEFIRQRRDGFGRHGRHDHRGHCGRHERGGHHGQRDERECCRQPEDGEQKTTQAE